MKIYVIGASGFLGANLVSWFSQSDEVHKAPSFDVHNPVEWKNCILKEIGDIAPDVVLIPGASQVSGDDIQALNSLIFSNCILPSSVAQQLLDCSPTSKLIIFGSSWQFADADYYRPFNLYAASKQAGQDLLEHYSLKGLKILQLIMFDTYGERDSRKKIFKLLWDACISGQEVETTSGEQEIDLVHIEDVCAGVGAAIDELNNWNAKEGLLIRGLGSGRPIQVRELIRRVERISGKKLLAKIGRRPYRDREVMKVFRKYIRPAGWLTQHKEYQNTPSDE